MRKILRLSMIVLLNIFVILTNVIASQEIKILYKINNSILTNIDIYNELNYLISLNNNLKDINKSENIEIAKESLIREKIKKDEIKKFFVIEKYENKDLMENILKRIYSNLGLANLNEFENYLNDYGISIENVKEKMKIEILWNQLISRKFYDQINIDEETIRQNVKDEKINYKEIIEYDLSEIVISPQNKDELDKTIKKINETIANYGFKTAANKFSISNSSKFGGNIGKVKENQLSKSIKEELQKITINEHSNPIYVNNNYIIIKVNEKNIITEKFDEDKVVEEIIRIEKEKQYENFSQIYFKKIKLNTQIYEF